MPQSLEIPVLTVDTNVIHKVDTANAENLFCMWTVFARCRDSVAHGRRLENLSWRLWNRETFCCENGEAIYSSATSKPQNIEFLRGSPSDDIPSLSGSVDSLADEEAVDFSAAALDMVRPRIRREDSWGSNRSRGRERHITSDELEKMVLDITEAKTPLDAPLPDIPRSPPMHEEPSKPVESARTGSTTDEESRQNSAVPSFESLPSEPELEVASPRQQTIVTRGFSPSNLPISRIISRPSTAQHEIPHPTDAPAAKFIQPKSKAKFALGGSSGSGSGSDQDFYNPTSQMEARKQPPTQAKGKMFTIGNSSDEDGSLKVPPQHLPRTSTMVNGQKKTASFNNEVVTQTFESSAISDGEDSDSDYVDESAIDDDDDEDWEEDSAEESGRSSLDEKLHFKRVDSSANLTSRRSLITLALANNNAQQAFNPRLQKLNNTASQSTSALPRTRGTTLNGPMVASPNDSDDAPLMMKRGSNRPAPMRPINEIPRSSAQPINVTASAMHYQAALSPRTTRRNMLATELTESLRRSLLWERSTKSKTANAVLKRRHTSHDVANLKEYPQAPCMKGDSDNNGWEYPPPSGYHTQGW
ncbi:hypothetical protein QBC44DRAFT_1969 [Cladorrhinum sp. PSN332]|nr:hypothetical protein QBC44DRAFT_1969 [Cladorrhinum sp. PSN332]